ncbi:ABC transporter substrate-binding protein [Actinomycetaceae bacterium L2_0104]
MTIIRLRRPTRPASTKHAGSARHPGLARKAAAALAALSLSFTLASCSSGADADANDPAAATGEPQEGGTLYWAIETKLQTVNPHRNSQDKATPVLRNAYDSFLYRTEEGEYQPWLASGYELSEDSKTLVLDLREGVTFSDGQTLDADAVVANFDKLTSPGYLSNIPGGIRFLESYEKTGDLQVTFHLSQADALFLFFLSSIQSTPLSPSTLQLPQTDLESGGPELAGVGPFTITEFTPNTELAFAKRADYQWAPESIADGQKAAYLDEVVYRTFAEGSTRTGSLSQGQVQISSDIQPVDVTTFEDDPNFTYVRNFVGGTPYSLYFNVSKAPLDDVRVREAFVRGFDRETILNSIYTGAFDVAEAPLSAGEPFSDPTSLEGYTEDIDAANELLDEAGWTERNSEGIRVKDGETLTIRAVSAAPFVRESRDQLNIAIGAALKKNLGIEYLFEIEDLGTEDARVQANDYEIFDNSYGGADVASSVDVLYSSDPERGFISRIKHGNADVDALVDAGRFNTDNAEREETYAQFQKLVADEFYVLPLYQTQDNLAYANTVHGVTIDPGTGQPFGAFKVWVD